MVFDKSILGTLFLIFPFVAFDWLFFFSMADEVVAGTDYLLIRLGTQTELVPMSHILDVTTRNRSRRYPERIALRLGVPSKFGREIKFIPTARHRQDWPQTPVTRFLLKREEE